MRRSHFPSYSTFAMLHSTRKWQAVSGSRTLSVAGTSVDIYLVHAKLQKGRQSACFRLLKLFACQHIGAATSPRFPHFPAGYGVKFHTFHTPFPTFPTVTYCAKFLLSIDFQLLTHWFAFWHALCALIGQKQQNNNKIKRHDYEKVFSLRRNGHGSSHSE